MQRTIPICLLMIALFIGSPSASAQRIVGELESNVDQDMLHRGDTVGGKKNQFVPHDVRAWTIDRRYGDRKDVVVDTLRHLFQNDDLNEGRTGHYNSLSNMGSPRLSRLYMERTEHDYLFLSPFDQFYVKPEDFKFFNTKSPFMNLTYQWAGSRTSGDDHFRALYTNNVGKRFNFGALYHYIYGKGYYDHQSTSFMDATAWASYVGDRYDLHLHYTHNFMKMGENGGIEDDRYITTPEDFSQSYQPGDIPVNLNATWNRQEHDIVYLNHRYHVGFTRTDSDSLGIHETFTPVTTFFHTLQFGSYRKNYRSYEQPTDFYAHDYLPGDSTNTRDRTMQFRNYLGISLREGFNKYAVAGLSAYVGFEHLSFNMPDTLASATPSATQAGRATRLKQSENNILVGGRILREQGRYIHWNADVEFTVAGDKAGDLKLNGEADLNIPLMGDTAQVTLYGRLSHTTPNNYYTTYHSRYAWWDNSLDRVVSERIGGQISFPKTRTRLRGAVENVKNFVYLADEGTAIASSDGTTSAYNHDAVVRQEGGNIQIVSLTLEQNFKLGILHLDNEVTYQTTSNEDVLPLPKLNLFHNLYLDFRIAHVLDCELGGYLVYFTEYYAPDYSPTVGLFMNQNKQNRTKIGNYPILSAYINFSLKRTRFYVQYYHANQGDGRYFWAPHYPMNPSCVRFGISWNFYD